MPQPIAVAIDFSPESERALTEAIPLARSLGVEIHMLHAIEPIDIDGEPDAARELEGQLRDKARENIAELHRRFDGQGAALFQALVEGDPAAAICDAAAELDCQLLVVGTHGRTGLRRFFSVASQKKRYASRAAMCSSRAQPDQAAVISGS